jgi:hypothetical protein
VEFADDALEARDIGSDVEAALGGDFLAALGHEADFLRLEVERLLGHAGGRGHFEVEREVDVAGDFADVGFLDVAAVFAEVNGDGVDAGVLGDAGGFEDAGFGREAAFPSAVTGFAEGGNVVDVEAEFGHCFILGPSEE